MRIVIDLQGAQSASRFRGIGRYSMSLVKAIVRNCGQHEVFIVLNGMLSESVEGVRVAFRDVLPQQNIFEFNVLEPVDALESENKWRVEVSELIREKFIYDLSPDVVLVSSLFEGAEDNTVTSIAKYFKNIPTASVLYDLIPLIKPDKYLVGVPAKEWYGDKLESLKRADLLLAISGSAMQEAIDYANVNANCCLNILSAADDIFIPVDVAEDELYRLNAQFGINRDFIMHVSAYEERKNFDGLVKAYALLPIALRAIYQLVLVCKLNDNDRKYLLSLGKELGLGCDDLILTGFVPDHELPLLYSACHLFVFPSFHEGFGLPALEAMKCGAATIGSSLSSIPEVIGLDEALFNPNSVEGMSSVMRAALEDLSFWERLKEHATLQSRKFDWDQSARMAIDAMEVLVKDNKLAEIDDGYSRLIECFSRINSKIKPSQGDLQSAARVIEQNEIQAMRINLALRELYKWETEAIADGRFNFQPIRSADPNYNAWIFENERISLDGAWLQSNTERGVSVLLAIGEVALSEFGATLNSLKSQVFYNWELVVAPVLVHGNADEGLYSVQRIVGDTDAKVSVCQVSSSRGEALRTAVAAAKEEFILVLEAGDILPPFALSLLVNRMVESPEIDILYADEDVIDSGLRRSPQFKPEWSPEYLRAFNYFGRPSVIRREAILVAGSFSGDMGVATEWDMHLRLTESVMDRVSTSRVKREPRVLCHRSRDSSHGPVDQASPEAVDFIECLRRHYFRQGIAAKVSLQADGTLHAEWEIESPPLVSVIIPNKNRANLLRVCLDGLWKHTVYQNLEIIVVDNGSTDGDILSLYEEARAARVKVVEFNETFNYSRACNLGAEAASGEMLLFLNNDIEVTRPDWLWELVRQATLTGVGVVGTKLVYPDGILQHAGVVIGMHICGLVFHRGGEYDWGPFGSPSVTRNWLGIMGACQMIRREVFDRIGGFDENYLIAMSDIKLTIDAWRAGYRTVHAPMAKLIHHEGASRGKSNPEKDMERTLHDIRARGFDEDPYFHPGLSAVPPVPTLRIAPDPSNRESLEQDALRLIGPLKSISETDLFDDSLVAFEANSPRSTVLWEPNPAGKIDSVIAAVRFIVDLLRSRSDIRARFPHALSEGVEGKFVQWLKDEALESFGYSSGVAKHIISAYSEALSVRAKQVVIFDYELRSVEPLLFLPTGRNKLIRVLFDAVKLGNLTREAAWWCLLELAEQPDRALIFTWQHTPEWQEKFPNGITRFGRDDFAAWLRANFQIDEKWLDASKWPDVLDLADQIRMALNGNSAWQAQFPKATVDRIECQKFLSFLVSPKSRLHGTFRDWLSSVDMNELADQLIRFGANVFGHFSYPSGLRTSAQSIIEGLRTAGFEFSLRNVPVSLATDEPNGSQYAGPELFGVSIVHVQPEPFFESVRQRSDIVDLKRRPYQIGYWYWEFETIPASWDSAAEQCDEIWTATEFIAQGLRARYKKPVHVFLPGVELPLFSRLPREKFCLPEEMFVFLFTFHMTSIMERKNPLGLIRAFKHAFSHEDQALLVIKTSFGNRHLLEIDKLNEEAKGANIRIIDEVYSTEESLSLMSVSDAYVSLHRSEGLGLTMAEAMLLGRPTIATRFSGNLDFMDDNNSLLVDFEYETLEKDCPPYAAGLRWANPSIEHAAKLMRRLYLERDFGRDLGLRAQADLQRRLSYLQSGRHMADRLLRVLETTHSELVK
jgi:glycosyltransferase involved in cell wall biosynthesis/GT2 family glycosyltransferase